MNINESRFIIFDSTPTKIIFSIANLTPVLNLLNEQEKIQFQSDIQQVIDKWIEIKRGSNADTRQDIM